MDAEEIKAMAAAAVESDGWRVADEASAVEILSNPSSWPTE